MKVKKSSLKNFKPSKLRTRYLKEIVANSTWIPTIAVIILYTSSVVLVFIGILKLYSIGVELFFSMFDVNQLDVIHLLPQFISIIEVYLLAIIFKLFAVGIYTLNVEEIHNYKGERVDSIEELKCELAKEIVLFLSVFLLQKIVLWDDGIHTLYYGIVITLISAVLIVFIMVLQGNIHKKRRGDLFMRRHDKEKDDKILALLDENGALKESNNKSE